MKGILYKYAAPLALGQAKHPKPVAFLSFALPGRAKTAFSVVFAPWDAIFAPANAASVAANATPVATNAAPVATNATPVAANATPVVANAAPVATNAAPVAANVASVAADTTPAWAVLAAHAGRVPLAVAETGQGRRCGIFRAPDEPSLIAFLM